MKLPLRNPFWFDRNTGILRKLEYRLLLFLCTLLHRASLPTLRKTARFIADIAFHLFRIRRRVTINNLRAAFPDKSTEWIRTVARDSNRNLFISLFEFLYSPRIRKEDFCEMLTLENREVLLEAIGRNRGLIVMTGHFGNWELLALGTMYILNLSCLIIVKKQRNHYVAEFVNALRTQYTNRVVYMKESVRPVLKELQKRGIVAMIADQSAPRESVYVQFFGREVSTFAGPARFALQSGAPVLMVFGIRRDDGGYRVIFEEVKTDDLKHVSSANVRELTGRHTALLERYIREYPDHWLWQHRRWKHVHPG